MRAIICAIVLMASFSVASATCTETCPAGHNEVGGSPGLCLSSSTGVACSICDSTDAASCSVPAETAEATTTEASTSASPEDAAAIVETCAQFESAGLDGVLFTDLEEGFDCSTVLTIATDEEKKAFHEAHNPTKAVWVFSDTDAKSEILRQELIAMSYWSVTSLGGTNGGVSECACRTIAVVEVEDTSYKNTIAAAVVMAILAVILCCGICFCMHKKEEYFPQDEEDQFHQVETKEADAEVAGATETDAHKKICEDKWVPQEEAIQFQRKTTELEEAQI